MDLTNERIDIMQITMCLQSNPTLPYVCETMVTLDNVTKWRQELSMYLRGPWNSQFQNITLKLGHAIMSINETRVELVLSASFFTRLWNKITSIFDPVNVTLIDLSFAGIVLSVLCIHCLCKRTSKIETRQVMLTQVMIVKKEKGVK